LIKEIADILKELGFKIVEIYDYRVKDKRIKEGYTIINRLELNGRNNLKLWLSNIKFYSPKHLKKIKGRNIAEDGFEFDCNLPNCIHRPAGLSRVSYEPSGTNAKMSLITPGTPD
jgi:ferredoxin-fold anticodon binding domain-containing protein